MRALTLIAVVTLTGCYDLPKPDCGFTCGPAGECPSSYACNMTIHRCELTGSSPSCEPAGNDAGPSDSQGDVTGPRVITQFPPSGALGVAFAVNISAQFDEPVFGDPVFGYTDSIFRVEHLGIEEPGLVMYDAATFTLTRPFSNLLPDTRYTVTVTPGITDAAGNGAFATWSFKTLDTIAPTVFHRAPMEDTTGVDLSVEILADFTEPVTGVSNVTFTLTEAGTPIAGSVSYTDIFGSRATFTPSTPLAPLTTYTVNLSSAIQDTATTPNSLAPVTWSFTTGP